eukprot:PhM_4_TR16138/c1_g3_i1/m.88042/K01674/cah; carbonic anhydrase
MASMHSSTKIVVFAVLCLVLLHEFPTVSAQTWTYANNAAVRWYESFPNCGAQNQSPVNIVHYDTRPSQPGFLKLWTPQTLSTNIRLYNDGSYLILDMLSRGVQLTGSGFWNNMVLYEVHFHAPAEHTINGVVYPMETHYVFFPQDHAERTAAGDPDFRIVAISVLHSASPTAISSDVISYTAANAATVIPKGSFLMLSWVPKFDFPDTYYTYKGTRTTPPCKEIVDWHVSTVIVPALDTDIAKISNALVQVTGSPMGNSRPVQPLNGRTVKIRTFRSAN